MQNLSQKRMSKLITPPNVFQPTWLKAGLELLSNLVTSFDNCLIRFGYLRFTLLSVNLMVTEHVSVKSELPS